jgi:pyruvate formate lyase activating enzyme
MQTIGGFQRSTLIDYPSKVACSVFFNGCNFKCGFCHNPFLIFNSSELISKEDVLSFLDKRVGLLDGVVLSGGEPCMFSEVVDFARKVKEKGFLVKLDTNGAFPDVLERMLPYLDYIAMDIKSSLESYSKVCRVGVNLENVKKSVKLIQESGVAYEFRTTVVPGLFDVCEMKKICEWLGKGKYVIQGFVSKGEHVDPSFNEKRGFMDEEIKEFVKIAEKCFDVEVRNV